jgi:hypothetical protein
VVRRRMHLRVRTVGGEQSSLRYAGDRRRRMGTARTTGSNLSGCGAGSRCSSSEPRAIGRRPSAFGRNGPAQWTPSGDRWRGWDLSGSRSARPRCAFGGTGAKAIDPDAFPPGNGDRAETEARQSSGCRADRDRRAADLRVRSEHRLLGARRSRDSSPPPTGTRVGGHRPRWHRAVKRPAERPGRRSESNKPAWQHRNVFDPKPMGASGGARRKRRVAATDSSVEEDPEVGGRAARSVATHDAGAQRSVATRQRAQVEPTRGNASR